jgi:nicotinate phosphoribosyltransferase
MPILTGDLDVEKLRSIVERFPQVAGFGVGTKLSSEVRTIAGVIFKECMIDGRPTLKASNTPEKTTLPGRLQIFRGIDDDGKYIADVTGLDDEHIEIPGAVRVERLLLPFWENGRHAAIPSIEKQKAFVQEQVGRFTDINNYPCSLSPRLTKLRDELTTLLRRDDSGWSELLNVPSEELGVDESQPPGVLAQR